MTYLQLGILVAEFFISTICLIFSLTTFFARKPVHVFFRKFSNRSIVDPEGFNKVNSLTLLLLSIPGFMSGVFIYLNFNLGLYITGVSYAVTIILASVIASLNFNQHIKRLIRKFMFETNKNNTVVKFEMFKKSNYIQAFEHLSINGQKQVLEANLDDDVYDILEEFVEENDIDGWNGFHESVGEAGKGYEWKIKVTYDDHSVIFAYGKDAFPLGGKPTVERLNDVLNRSFINRKV